jgi:periplasmic protein TonB
VEGLKGYDSPPEVVKYPRPDYPREAAKKKIDGAPTIDVLVNERGEPVRVEVRKSILGLDESAMRSAWAMRFRPAMKGGKPVAALVQSVTSFRIR